ncbi:MAG: molecular chaperone TorD family protein [Campylobacteraceae bacterium]
MIFKNKNKMVEELQSDAEIFALLASFYLTNPNGTYASGMAALEVDMIEDKTMKKVVKKIRDYASKCGMDESEVNLLELKRDWTKLFRGISPTYGPKPPYAQLFSNAVDVTFLSALAELYLDVGYVGYKKIDDRLDYIGIVLDALAVINILRKKSVEDNNEVEYKRLTYIFNCIAQQYFASWFKDFQELAQTHVKTPFFEGAIELTALVAEDFSIKSQATNYELP